MLLQASLSRHYGENDDLEEKLLLLRAVIFMPAVAAGVASQPQSSIHLMTGKGAKSPAQWRLSSVPRPGKVLCRVAGDVSNAGRDQGLNSGQGTAANGPFSQPQSHTRAPNGGALTRLHSSSTCHLWQDLVPLRAPRGRPGRRWSGVERCSLGQWC